MNYISVLKFAEKIDSVELGKLAVECMKRPGIRHTVFRSNVVRAAYLGSIAALWEDFARKIGIC